MFTLDELFHGSIRQKRRNAREVFEKIGDELARSAEIKEKLANLIALSESLYGQMASMNMFSLCVTCGRKKGGGCCSAYMANETDAVLLLINLLLGVEVRSRRDDDFECCYLGDKGCTLKIKPMFCLNYNCQAILTGNSPEVLVALEKAASAVLRGQYELEQLLLVRLLSPKTMAG